jgi:DNA polymerase III psi subunit
VPKSLLRHLKLTDWQLCHPDQLPYVPNAAQGLPVCWVVGSLPDWIADLCLILRVARHQHLPEVAALPEQIPEHDWILWVGNNSQSYPHERQLSLSALSSAKQQLWHQICQYEY